MSHAQRIATQHTTNGLFCHPGILLALYFAMGILTGSFFLNWSPTQTLFLHSQAYSWLCQNVSLGKVFSVPALSVCPEQLQAIDGLMPIGVAAMFGFAFIGGGTIDFFGPKVCAVLGLLIQIAGWTLLIHCSETFPFYSVAILFIGFGDAPMYFVMIDAAALYPFHQGFIISFMTASRAISFALPSGFNWLLKSAPETFTTHTIFIMHVCILGLCLLLACFICPWKSFRNCLVERVANISGERSHSLSRMSAKEHGLSNASLPTAAGPSQRSGSFMSEFSLATSKPSVPGDFRPSRALPQRPVEDCLGGLDYSNVLESSYELNSKSSQERSNNSESSHVMNFKEVIQSGRYLPLFAIAGITIVTTTFLAKTSQQQMPSASSLIVYLNPLSSLPTILFGYLVDRIGSLNVMLILNILSILQLVCLLLMDVISVVEYIAAFVGFPKSSFFLAQFYCFVALECHPRDFGVAVGLIVTLSGLLSLVVTPMCDFSSFAQNYSPMNSLCLALTIGSLPFLYLVALSLGNQWSLHPDLTKSNSTTDIEAGPPVQNVLVASGGEQHEERT